MLYRPTLECEEEEEVHAVDLNRQERDPEDHPVCSLHCYSEQEDTDTKLEEEVADNVDWLANPPPLSHRYQHEKYLRKAHLPYLHADRVFVIGNEISSFARTILDAE